MKYWSFIVLVFVFCVSLGAQAKDKPERVIMLYIDGLHPEAIDFFDLENLRDMRDSGAHAQKGVMGFPAHPTILPYGEWHYTSVPNVMTMAGTLFLTERPTYIHQLFAKQGKTTHSAGSRSYRSLNIGFDYAMTTGGVTDAQVIDFYLHSLKSESDILYSRIMLQQAGNAGRKLSGKNVSNAPWAQNIFHKDSPYGKALKVADREIGRLREELRALGKLDSTLFTVMGDGQSLYGWHQTLDEHADLTPIMFSGPGIRPGKQIPYAENIDVVPTIAYIMGVDLPEGNGGEGVVLTSMLKGGEALEHPRYVERINKQIRDYYERHSRATLQAFEDPKMNLLLMELEHAMLSEHQFFTVERVMEWHEAGDLPSMIKANDWVLETLRLALEEKVYRFSTY